jgi:hypothetical protein
VQLNPAVTEWRFSAIVSRFAGQGVSDWIGARRPSSKYRDWRGAGGKRTFS